MFTIIACLAGAVLVGSFWGMADIAQALIMEGGGRYPRSALLTLTLYTVTSVLLATLFSLVGTKIGLSSQKIVNFTLSFLFSLYGCGLIAMFSNLYLLPSIRDIRSISANIGFLILFGLSLFFAGRVRNQISLSLSKLTVSVPLVTLIWLALIGYSAWGREENRLNASLASVAPLAKDAPNFLVIVVDSLRADHLSPYGYNKPTSPTLEAIAREGMVFFQAYAQSSWTLPSVASLMTSLYPSNHGTSQRREKLPGEISTLPELLRERGYVTAAFTANAWISSGFGLDQGFDYFYETQDSEGAGFLHSIMAYKLYQRVRQLFPSSPITTVMRFGLALFGLGEEKPTNCQEDSAINREVSTWLSANGHKKPFFIYIHYMCAHHPYEPPNSREKLDWQVKVIKEGSAISEEARRSLISAYDKSITYSDSLIAEIVEQLRQLKIYDQTFLVITADHGDEFYEHENWGHGHTLYNDLLHVPLILRYPRLVRPAQAVKRPVMLVDIMPTLLATVRIPANHSMQGKDLLAKTDGFSDDKRRVYSELLGGARSRRKILQASIKEGEKFIKTMDPDGAVPESFELYNLQQDLQEKRNLWSVQKEEIRKSWEAGLSAFSQSQIKLEGEKAVISEEMKRRLRALGYIQ